MLPQDVDLQTYREEIQKNKQEQNEIIEEEHYNKINYLYDFKKGDFVLKNGRLTPVTGVEGIKVWVEKNLRTTINTYKIYEDFEDREFGVGIKPLLLGKKLPSIFREAEVERDIEEALQEHPAIKGITNFTLQHDITTLKISFQVILVNNDDFNFIFDFGEGV